MSGPFGDPQRLPGRNLPRDESVVPFRRGRIETDYVTELVRSPRGRDRSGPFQPSHAWLVVFYAAIAIWTVLWAYHGEVGVPRLFMGSLLLLAVTLWSGRAVGERHPIGVFLVPALIVVAAFFWYPLAPTAIFLGVAFLVNVMWFS